MFSHEVEEEAEVAPNIVPDDYNEDDAAGNLGRSFTDEEIQLGNAQAEQERTGFDETEYVGVDQRGTTEGEVRLATAQSEQERTGFDESEEVGLDQRGTTDSEVRLAEAQAEQERTGFDGNENVDLGDRQSRATPTSIASHSTGDEELSLSGPGQGAADTPAESPAVIHLPGLPREGVEPPEGYHLVRLNDGSYAYQQDRPFRAVRDAAEDWLDSRPEGQQVPLQTHLYMGEGSPNFYIDESGQSHHDGARDRQEVGRVPRGRTSPHRSQAALAIR